MRSIITASLLLCAANPVLAADKVDFMTQIQPLLKAHCYKCHGPRADKGDLRLHSSELLLEYVVIPGDLESDLYLRLLEEDEELRMPKSADPLPSEAIELFKLWIEQGAEMPEGFHVEVVEENVIEDSDPATPEALDALESTGALVLPLANGFNLLTVSFATHSGEVNDALIAPLEGVAEQVTWLNLAGSNVTDAGLATIGKMKNLSKLHLEKTQVTDAGLTHLAGLEKLEYLNLYGTQITDAGLEYIQNLPNLKKLYLWQTNVNYEPAMELQASVDGLEVNLGWDHPGVRRARLEKELARAKSQKEDAALREETARAEKEDATRREKAAERDLINLERELRGEPPLEEEEEESDDAEKDSTKESDEEEPADEDEEPEAEDADDDDADDDADEREADADEREADDDDADDESGDEQQEDADAPVDA